MLTWLAFKTAASAAWKSTMAWCKERWELLVGVLVGILGMLAITNRRNDMDELIEEKNDLRDKELDALRDAREKEDAALKKNLEKFFETNEQARKDYEDKLSDLDEEKKKRVIELLSSDDPEVEIANKLKEFLG